MFRNLLAKGRLFVAVLLVLGAATPVLAKNAPMHVTGAEVTLKKKKMKHGPEMVEALRKAVEEEAAYYDASATPVLMRVQIEKLAFYSEAKEALMMVPLIGGFAGTNENRMKAKVQLVEPASGKVLKKFTVDCNDSTLISAEKEALGIGLDILSVFVPGASLAADLAVGVGEAAFEKKRTNQQVLTDGFTMLAYRKIYDGKTYKMAQKRKKEAVKAAAAKAKEAPVATAAQAAPVETAAPAVSGGAAPAATEATTPVAEGAAPAMAAPETGVPASGAETGAETAQAGPSLR